MPNNEYIIPIEEAAHMIGLTVEMMKQILIQGEYSFGIVLRNGKEGQAKYRYIVFRKRFEDFINSNK